MNDEIKRKRLGQYFSGRKVSNLLSAFINIEFPTTIIDPMCGLGDMLIAADQYYPTAKLVGIDIDEDVTKKIKRTKNKSGKSMNIITGSAFKEETICQLPKLEFDLVITNPPYVRYQSFSNKQDKYPSSTEVREGLLNLIPMMEHLDDKDKKIFEILAKNYSGLSDLAVPSWILCALLTKMGGQLAMVVPESWLSRDYATPIHYLLLKFFRIEYIVEDLDRTWFKDNAQVKTNLIIATRIPQIENLWVFYKNEFYTHIALTSEYESEKSLVGKLYTKSDHPEVDFFQDIKKGNIKNLKGIKVREIGLEKKLDRVFNNSKNTKWFQQVEKKEEFPLGKTPLPSMLEDIIPLSYREFKTLESLGVGIGQGLRTGANKFFYVDYLNELNNECIIKPNDEITSKDVKVPLDAVKVVIRKQSELPLGFSLDERKLIGRVLTLDNYIHPSDLKRVPHKLSSRNLMSQGLAELVSQTEKLNFGTQDNPRFIPENSAVRSNVRTIKTGDLDTAGFWYMLPKLAARHLPDIFIARVNGGKPKFFLNSTPKAVVDANFSGLWIRNNQELNKYSLLALLNSDWVRLCCEMLGAVMGGGALKIEATHIKKIPIPILSLDEYKELTLIGKNLTLGKNELDKVNKIIARKLFNEKISSGEDKIKKLLQTKLANRSRRG